MKEKEMRADMRAFIEEIKGKKDTLETEAAEGNSLRGVYISEEDSSASLKAVESEYYVYAQADISVRKEIMQVKSL
jgi:hypothetical protein